MKQFKLSALFFISAIFVSSAAFADIGLKYNAIAPVVTAPYNWTGFYGGLNAGGVQHTMTITDNHAVAFYATLQQPANPQFTGGFQVGYRRQLDLTKASGVYGLELSANFSNASFSQEYGSGFALYHLDSQNQLKNVGLAQLIGGIAADRTLLFLAAGLSWVNITGSTTSLDGLPFFNSFSVAKNAVGTAIGGGVEYALTNAISVRIKVDLITPVAYTTSDDNNNDYRISNSIVQGTFGVNYKFG